MARATRRRPWHRLLTIPSRLPLPCTLSSPLWATTLSMTIRAPRPPTGAFSREHHRQADRHRHRHLPTQSYRCSHPSVSCVSVESICSFFSRFLIPIMAVLGGCGEVSVSKYLDCGRLSHILDSMRGTRHPQQSFARPTTRCRGLAIGSTSSGLEIASCRACR